MWQIDYYQYFLDTVLSVFLLYHIKCFITVADHTVVHQTLHFCVCLCLLGHRWLKLLFHPSVNWNTDFYKSQRTGRWGVWQKQSTQTLVEHLDSTTVEKIRVFSERDFSLLGQTKAVFSLRCWNCWWKQ